MARAERGFTLLELMVVVAIVALATVGVSLTLPDGNNRRLETEALRLSALLESARAQSRSSGVPVFWRVTADGFEFTGGPTRPRSESAKPSPQTWLQPETRARIVRPRGAGRLVLGPEPLIDAQSVQLSLGEQQLTLSTDGLAPFAVAPEAGTP